MNDHLQFLDSEELVTCPYNMAHTCPRKRFALHLVKCRKQHQELAKELRDCIHNIQHKIPRPEYEYHLEICPDRSNFYQSQYQIGVVENDSLPQLLENVRIPVNVPEPEENWDEEPPVDVLKDVKQSAQAKNVLQICSNEPPAVRKAVREENRRKHRDMQNAAERREKELLEASKPSSSRSNQYGSDSRSSNRRDRDDDDDDASVVSLSSARSDFSAARSDVSYKTALTNTKKSLNEFQKVERKRPRGRGSGMVSSQTPNVQQGIGRGRNLGGAYRFDEVWSSRRTDRGERPYSYQPY